MTGLLGSNQIKSLASEESVRGVLVRMVLEQAEGADSDEMKLLEQALQLLLSRFQAIQGDAS
ncbi:MAG: hypothetical protein JRE56_02505 [Deltaproteobacteria bacterium]|jgi:hypothetical protein|nr:hypothetical protein [Deltaproteobacteria bacterium]